MVGFLSDKQQWREPQAIENRSYICGYCGDKVSVNRGFAIMQDNTKPPQRGGAYICHNCQGITFFTPDGRQLPAPSIGEAVAALPEDVGRLYEEARKCTSAECYTAAVMCTRKILMNLAVEKGAPKDQNYAEYVAFLSSNGFVPPGSERWVDEIRKRGNEANHELPCSTQEDAELLVTFVEALLRFIFEFPSRYQKSEDSPGGDSTSTP